MEASNIYVKRLYGEWVQHGKIIVGVDYDNTISPYTSPYHPLDNTSDIDRVVKILKESQSVGVYIMIHTSCAPDRHAEIIEYCMGKGIQVDSINETPVSSVPFGKLGSKPFANIYLDDRAGLTESLDILEMALYMRRSYDNSKRLDYPGSGG